MTWAAYLNEVDLSTIGFYLEQTSAKFGAPARQFPTVAIPGRNGVVVAADPTVSQRTLTLQGTIDPALRTVAQRVAFEDQLKAVAMNGLVGVVIDDDITAPRRIDGLCTDVSIDPVAHPAVTQVSRARLTLQCPDPTWYDVTGQMIGFSSTPSAIPLGTAPSGGVVRISAPAWSANVVNPVLTYLNAAALVQTTLTFTLTLAAGTDYLEIDLDRLTAVKYASGVASNAITLLTGDFFALDPMDGDVVNAAYPLLKATATSGTPSAQWLGVRRWL